jgi:hypothetical protein
MYRATIVARNRRVDIGAMWRRGQQGWPSRFVLIQFPNAPLIAALAGFGLSRATDGRVGDYGDAVGRLGLAVFAYLELTDGANWFRRLVGAIVGITLVISLERALH